jgi:predicted nucleic acid-binding protein
VTVATITEVVYLLDFEIRAQVDFLRWVYQAVHIDDATPNDLPRIIEILQKYVDLPADFTDASLIALCERLKTSLVATVDSDFTIYRDAAKRPFNNTFFDR